MVTVIARSSVNVNNGGAIVLLIFHAIFIAIYLSFKDQIQRIALPALAAILVYTGYMLSSQNFIRILKIGKEQLLIFLITLVTSIISGIIFGILIRIISTFIIHVL